MKNPIPASTESEPLWQTILGSLSLAAFILVLMLAV